MKKMKIKDLMNDARKQAMARIEAGQEMRKSPKAQVEGDVAHLYIYDVIDTWWGVDPKEFIDELNAIEAGTIHLHINSPGGSVFDARTIQTALAEHPAKVITHIDGLAASAVTYIAITQDEVHMAEGALFMIHNAWTFAWGNAEELKKSAALLEKIDTTIVTDYKNKTGSEEKKIREWMKAETWFSAAEALEEGFIDTIFSPASQSKENTTEDSEEPEENTDKATNVTDAGNLKNKFDTAARLREVELLAMRA
ncbi:head maturation protease, ClpP-related [Maridesulfovibrio ferrireducens]|uniref:head maturation protease, ClpP-related n=1 Tax=Maridesulfovibrio ferrireducens TaxID=246191 RepID=UPI001A24CCA0|nr:head maturation protease, ClpP-related [Maridesulfovibrio ferrireducens]MBI9110283.1 Clp protease ClpP [Maridesulfovibrio ferrireducens]